MFQLFKKSDEEVRRGVREAVDGNAALTSDDIGVLVNDGVVTLQGSVPDFVEKKKAEDVAWGVTGVRGVVNQLEVEHFETRERIIKRALQRYVERSDRQNNLEINDRRVILA